MRWRARVRFPRIAYICIYHTDVWCDLGVCTCVLCVFPASDLGENPSEGHEWRRLFIINLHIFCFFQLYWQIKLLCLEPWALILARAIAGIPCSACYIVLPIYLKEISDIDLRGALGSLLILNR